MKTTLFAIAGPIAALLWSARHAVTTLWVIWTFPSADEMLALNKQTVQTAFSRYGIYIPANDIVIQSAELLSSDSVAKQKQNCNGAATFIWVPLKIQIPIFGERIFEWCWTSKNSRENFSANPRE